MLVWKVLSQLWIDLHVWIRTPTNAGLEVRYSGLFLTWNKIEPEHHTVAVITSYSHIQQRKMRKSILADAPWIQLPDKTPDRTTSNHSARQSIRSQSALSPAKRQAQLSLIFPRSMWWKSKSEPPHLRWESGGGSARASSSTCCRMSAVDILEKSLNSCSESRTAKGTLAMNSLVMTLTADLATWYLWARYCLNHND